MHLGDFVIGIVENGQAPSALAMKTQTKECNTLIGIIRYIFSRSCDALGFPFLYGFHV